MTANPLKSNEFSRDSMEYTAPQSNLVALAAEQAV